MTDPKTYRLMCEVSALLGYLSATPKACSPYQDPNEMLGAWNRWESRLEDYTKKCRETLDKAIKDRLNGQ